MENLTTLLCALFTLVKQRRVTVENLRRFVECPERLNDNWATATVEEQLAEIAANPAMSGTFGNWATYLREDVRFFAREGRKAREEFGLRLAQEAFRIGREEGVSMIQMRWLEGRDREYWREEDVQKVRVDDLWKHAYGELLSIVERAIAGERVSPYERVIFFENCATPSGELIAHAAAIPSELEEREFAEMGVRAMSQLAADYWQPYLRRGRQLIAERAERRSQQA